ncbi:MAG: DUF87 domain-containing protein [Candidatus Micrarchaeia archaeon]
MSHIPFMGGALSLQRVLSGELSRRNFLTRPPEPSPEMLLSQPSGSVFIGKTKLLSVPFFWGPKKLVNPHLCVAGITGSGKSYFIKTFITRANIVMGSNALILDWAGEYCDWVRAAGGRVISFGQEGINLLELGGASPHNRSRQVLEALELLAELPKNSPQARLTEEALEQAYGSKGFAINKPAHSGKKAPTLQDVHRLLLARSKSKKDAAVSQDSSEAARRIRNLLLSSGKSFTVSTFPLSSLLSGLVCVDLHSLPSESLRSIAGLAILQFVKERMRAGEYSATPLPKLFVVVDEAWKIASDGNSEVATIVREGRKYGFSLIVASQNPTDVHRSIFSSAGTVMCFRLTLSSEREYVRSSLSYSDYFEEQSHSLSVGQALVHLEFSRHQACPRDFIISKIEGEELLETCTIRGGKMVLELEKSELSRKLLSFGLTDRQSAEVFSEFERKNYSVEAQKFAAMLEKMGHGKSAVVSLLRDLGASERELLSVFSEGKGRGEKGALEAEVSLRDEGRSKK